jgi:hypothetical protein
MEARLSPRLACFALLVAASSCGSPGTDLEQLVTTTTDSGTSGSGGGQTTSYQDPFSGAPAYSAQGSGGGASHNAGKSCMAQGCHSSAGGQSGAPSFLIGGTVYQDYFGQTPAVGVEVRIVDSVGNAASAYSDSGGNFYIRSSSSNGVTFPAIVGARDATTTRPMIRQLTSSMGSCAQSPCHVAGGSPSSGAYYPIHAP